MVAVAWAVADRLDARGPRLELALPVLVGGVAGGLHVVHERDQLVLRELQRVGLGQRRAAACAGARGSRAGAPRSSPPGGANWRRCPAYVIARVSALRVAAPAPPATLIRPRTRVPSIVKNRRVWFSMGEV